MGKKINSDKTVYTNLKCSREVRNKIMDSYGSVIRKRALIDYIIHWWFSNNADPASIAFKYFKEDNNSTDNVASIPCSKINQALIKQFCLKALSMSWLMDKIILDFLKNNKNEDLLKKVLEYDTKTSK